MSEPALAEVDAQYRLIREECAFVRHADDGFIEASGTEAAAFLQGQVTNDVEALESGSASYSALLDRKAHIQADMDILCLDRSTYLIHTEPEALPPTLKHLDMYKIGREVDVSDRSAELELIKVIGPAGEAMLGLRPGPELSHRLTPFGGAECRIVSRPIGDLPAFELIFAAGRSGEIVSALEAAGAEEITDEAVDIGRIEAGVPRFGRELTSDRMPAEAGIVDRAVSFSKGCYIGQEPVARLHYRGRPNRFLRYLELSELSPAGSVLELDGKPVGELTSSALSPARGAIGLAVLRREAEPGSVVTVAEAGARATVRENPFTDRSPR